MRGKMLKIFQLIASIYQLLPGTQPQSRKIVKNEQGRSGTERKRTLEPPADLSWNDTLDRFGPLTLGLAFSQQQADRHRKVLRIWSVFL